MKIFNKKKKYTAFTLSEMLIVITIIVILSSMTFSSFGSLRNTIRLNEYLLNLEQDVRAMQRASMLLQRNSYENWVYGIGIDFSKVESDGYYKFIKWCSTLSDYGDITTRTNIPGFNPGAGIISEGNGNLPLPDDGFIPTGLCEERNSVQVLRELTGYEKPMSPPQGKIRITALGSQRVQYVIFEAISGRAFMYDSSGNLLNYDADGNLLDINDILDFTLTIKPDGVSGKERKITVKNLSGKIDTYQYKR